MKDTNLDILWTKIAAVSRNEVRIAVLKDEIELYKTRLRPRDTGYLHDGIALLRRRIDEIKQVPVQTKTYYTHEQKITSTVKDLTNV